MEALALVQDMNLIFIEIQKLAFDLLNRPIGLSPKASVDKAPKLKLKILHSHLKYVYLGDNNTLPVILSTGLSDVKIRKAMAVLKKMKKAIGWQMFDIIEINLAFCMPNIYMEEGYKPRV